MSRVVLNGRRRGCDDGEDLRHCRCLCHFEPEPAAPGPIAIGASRSTTSRVLSVADGSISIPQDVLVSSFIRPEAQLKLVTLGAPIMAAGQCQIVPAFDDFAVAVPFVRVGHWGNVGAVTRPTDQRRLFEAGSRYGRTNFAGDWPCCVCGEVQHARSQDQERVVSAGEAVRICRDSQGSCSCMLSQSDGRVVAVGFGYWSANSVHAPTTAASACLLAAWPTTHHSSPATATVAAHLGLRNKRANELEQRYAWITVKPV
jgi:hypothetical protein